MRPSRGKLSTSSSVLPAAIQASNRCSAVASRPYLLGVPQTSGYSGSAGVKLKSPATIADAGGLK